MELLLAGNLFVEDDGQLCIEVCCPVFLVGADIGYQWPSGW